MGTDPPAGTERGGGASTEPLARDGDVWRMPAADGQVSTFVRIPGSKSITNRALVLAALASEPTVIGSPLVARDTRLMAGALRALGCHVEESAGSWLVEPKTPGERRRPVDIDVGN